MNGLKNLVAGGAVPSLYQRILSIFPRDISLCFAYGSAVFPQKKLATNPSKQNVIDLVFVVPNAFLWHEENLKQNPKHYSSLRYLGHRAVTRIQESYGAGVYYNTLIPFEDVEFKYGVVSQTCLITDLLDWNYLYLAGRLHKPVLTLYSSGNPQLRSAIDLNLYSAMHAALLLLPETFTEMELYRAIAGISYDGDFRMIFGEDRNKVRNIVDGQTEYFRALYAPVIQSMRDYMELSGPDGEMKGLQDPSPMAKMYHLNQLPRTPQRKIVNHWHHMSYRKDDTEDVLAAIAHDIYVDAIVKQSLKDIVWESSVWQSLKGIFTAGILKSVKYSLKKIRKMNLSLRSKKSEPS